ncbi:hypothetical protein GCM10010869_06250 [Mesorhizobium tianshanense]|nr:hypothetical protein GCM10010869_06250 [Mesorhizobium tianshanense]
MSEQKSQQHLPGSDKIALRLTPRSDQIAHRLVIFIRNPDRRQFTRTQQPRERNGESML